jgi:hypothetical protein
MRNVLLLVCCLLVAATAAMGQGKVDNQWNCAKPTASHSLDVPDRANHSYQISQISCTAAKGELAGVKEKEGAATQFTETSGNSSNWHGVFVETLENGDKGTYTYRGKGTMKDGVLQVASHSWTLVSGTGKLKGAKASGTCKGTGSADGSVVWDCTGTITLAK